MERWLRIGVLALQGAFREHVSALRKLDVDVVEVRLPDELEGIDGLVIPGGESTTIMRLAELYRLDDSIRAFRGAIFGTCAGMIVLDRKHLDLADLEVDRNAFGRQVRSFEADVSSSTTRFRSVASSFALLESAASVPTSRCSASSTANPCSYVTVDSCSLRFTPS